MDVIFGFNFLNFLLLKFLLERVGKIKIFLHKSKNDKELELKKSAIVMMNHRTRLDWLFYFCILYRLGALSNIKIILKKGLDKIPGAGLFQLLILSI